MTAFNESFLSEWSTGLADAAEPGLQAWAAALSNSLSEEGHQGADPTETHPRDAGRRLVG